MRLENERWLVEEQMRHVQEEHETSMKKQKCLPEERCKRMNEQNQLLNGEEEKFSDEDMETRSTDQYAVAQSVVVEKEKEEISGDVIKDKDESNPVILSKERIDFDEDEIEEEKLKLPKRKRKNLSRRTVAELQQKVNLKASSNMVLIPQHWSLRREYSQDKSGIGKLAWKLSDFIKRDGIVPFEESEVILEFHSDGATSRPGFHIRGQQMDCAPLADKVIPPTPAGGCDATFTNGSGTIQSPGFPEPYPSSRRCVYRFVALPEHCRITLQFLEFGLQTDDALCEKDFLRINGIKYCGPQLLGQKRTVTFYGYPREVNVTFESDEQLSDKGFYAVYRQLPCSPALGRSPSQRTDSKPRMCDRLYASLAFSILSPGHPDNYPPDVNCRYTIRRLGPKICRLKLSFRQFDVESSEGCEYDYLEVDGKKICGTLPANEIRMVEFKDYQTIFTFHSDSANSKSGFVIKVEQEECQDGPPLPPPQPPKTQKVQPPKFEHHHHFEPPVAEPPLIEEPYIYPQPHFEYEHLVDYPVYEASSLQRNLQVIALKKYIFGANPGVWLEFYELSNNKLMEL
ncbi:tolloid-like protein 2 [Trichonephila clavipes]|nr:tolloid-like protein 2 [Trichonephila clavipes]